MNGLSPEARAVLDAARAADRGSTAQRERVRAALAAQLVPAAVAAKAAPAVLLAKAVAGGAVVVSVAVGVHALPTPRAPAPRPRPAAVGAHTRRPLPPLAIPAARPVTPAPAFVAPALVIAPPPAPPPPRPRSAARARPAPVLSAVDPVIAPPVAEVPPTPPAPAPDPIADELRRLEDAQVAFDRHEDARALRLLDAYAHQHPSGALREESVALRVLTLCALDRRSEARDAARFFVGASRSPAAARVRASCVREETIPSRIEGPAVIP